MSSRWDRLLDQKPIALIDHLVEEAAKLIAADFQRWPLPVEEIELAAAKELAPLFLPDAPRPAREAYVEAVRLAGWDLAREHEAYDDYMRNRRYLEHGLSEADRARLLLLSRWLLEQLLSLTEATQGRVSRARLRTVLESIARKLPQ
jgi:hypothetical protein